MTIVLLAALALALAAVLERPLERVIPPVLLGASLVVYLCMLAGRKSASVPLLAVLLAGLCLAALLRYHRGHRFDGARRLSPASVGLVLAMAAVWILVQPFTFAVLDDLIHWALNTKQLCGLESFPSVGEQATSYGDYPPGVQMLLVLLQMGRPFSHPLLFWGQLLWCTGLALPLLEPLRWTKRWWSNLLLALGSGAFLLLLPALFNWYYTVSLVVEPVMALLLGYLLFTAWRARKGPDGLDVAGVLLAAGMLVLAKSTGALYAALGLAAVLLLWRHWLWSGRRAVHLCLAAGLYAVPAAFWLSWQRLCAARGYVSYFSQDAPEAYSLQNLRDFVQGQGLAGQVIPNFCRALAFQPLAKHWGLSALGILAAAWALAVLLGRLAPGKADGLRSVLALLSVGFAVYAASVCYSYVYLFDPEEAEGLSAFSRYIAPLPAALLILVLGAALRLFWGRGKRLAWGCAGAVFLLCVNWVSPGQWIPRVYADSAARVLETELEPGQVQARAEQLHAALQPGDRVLVITEMMSSDRAAQLFRYEMLPNPVAYWSLAECGSTHAMSQTWNDCLRQAGFEAVYCAPDGQATAQSQALIDMTGVPVQAGRLYRPVIQGQTIRLEPVE